MNRTRPSFVALVALVCLTSLAIAPPIGAQTPVDSPILKEGVKASIQVQVMDLDVVAESGGKRVTDLRKEELTVKVDGKALPLDYFIRVDSGTLHGPDLGNASPDLVLETTKSDTGDRYVPRQFLVFFDDAHLLPFERKRAIEGLRDFITRLVPSDRVSIAAYGGSTRVLVPYTGSKEDLLDGLSKLEKTPPSGLSWDLQYRQDVRDIRRSRSSTRSALLRTTSEQIYQREKATLIDLARAISSLSARSGKRALIYVSNGLELRPGQSLQQALGPSLLSQFDYSVSEYFRKVLATANRSGVTIHTIDAKGLTVDDVDAGESDATPFNSFFVSQNLLEALAGMAAETGGKLVTSRNDFKPALDAIYQESSSYYSVGVTLTSLDPKKKDHGIAVTTSRPGVSLRTRKSYGVKSPDEAMLDRMEMALLTPGARGDFPVKLAIGLPKKDGGKRVSQYEVAIPIGALTFVDEAGQRKTLLDISLAAVEDDGARSDITTARKGLKLDPAKWDSVKGQTYKFTGELRSRKGNIRFVATVRDVASDRIGIAEAAVHLD